MSSNVVPSFTKRIDSCADFVGIEVVATAAAKANIVDPSLATDGDGLSGIGDGDSYVDDCDYAGAI